MDISRARCICLLQSNVTPAQLSELEAAEAWVNTQAMLAILEEQEERLQTPSH